MPRIAWSLWLCRLWKERTEEVIISNQIKYSKPKWLNIKNEVEQG